MRDVACVANVTPPYQISKNSVLDSCACACACGRPRGIVTTPYQIIKNSTLVIESDNPGGGLDMIMRVPKVLTQRIVCP